MLIHSILPASRANGPGLRAVVWTQGCVLNCPGCHNPETHAFTGGKHLNNSDVARAIREAHATQPIEGVTFSGGEPMHQPYSLLGVMEGLLDLPLTWGMFSGFTIEELENSHDAWPILRQMLDFAILGRYDRTKSPDHYTAPLCSSSNQKLHLFQRCRYGISDFLSLYETTISPAGLVQVSGFPNLPTGERT